MFGRRCQVVVGAAAFAATLLYGSSVSAHVGVDKDEIVAGESTTVSFSVTHGCGDSPTNSMKFQVPDGVDNAVPQVHPGWDITVERAELDEPIESGHGDPVTDRPAVITFTARDGNEVPSGQRDTFTLSFRAPETEGQLFFPVVQGCVAGEHAWIAQWDGTGSEPDSPAPSVMVVAGSSGTDDHGDETETETRASTVTTSIVTSSIGDTATGGDDGGSSSNGLAIAGIVVGALGLGTGGLALARSRTPQSPDPESVA